MANFQARLDHLFRTVRAPDGGEYTYREVAEAIEQLVGYKTSPSYLQVLRTGVRINPSIKHLHGLCAFFGVPIEYFFDADVAAQLEPQLELAASLRDPAVRQLATLIVGLSAEAMDTLTRVVDYVRRVEGLEAPTAGGTTPNSAPTPSRSPRRERRGRAPGRETPPGGSRTADLS